MKIEQLISELLLCAEHRFSERIDHHQTVFPERLPEDVKFVFQRYNKIEFFYGLDESGNAFENQTTLEPDFSRNVSELYPTDFGDGFEQYSEAFILGNFLSGEEQIILDLSNGDKKVRGHVFYPPLPFKENIVLAESLTEFLELKLKEKAIRILY